MNTERQRTNAPLLRQSLVRTGVPYEVIKETAIQEESDLIILATHGRTGLARALLGSLAEVVVRTAPCPVLVVRALREAEQSGVRE